MMTLTPIRDEGQKLPPPTGKVLGVVDTREQLDEVVAALKGAGFDQISAIHGEDGVSLLERLDGFFFSDADEPVLQCHIKELKAGHYSFAAKTLGGNADELADIASNHGARFLVHFGFAATTWLKK
jgi:hypothetical protein